MTLKICRKSERAPSPAFAHPGEDACFDLSVLVDDGDNDPYTIIKSRSEYLKSPVSDAVRICDEEGGTVGVVIMPGDSVVFHTGIAVEIETGHVMRIYPRSSTGIKRHLALDNGTGIIDSGYRGEIMIAVHNFGRNPETVMDGDRIVQCEICPVVDVNFVEAEELSDSARGGGGIGSTGN